MALSAGRLRHRIDIQKREQVQDPVTGAMTTTWVNEWSSVPAAIEPLSVREFMQSQANQAEISARITIRYREGLVATMRIVHKDRIYNPEGFLQDPDSGLEYVTIPCSEGVNDGE